MPFRSAPAALLVSLAFLAAGCGAEGDSPEAASSEAGAAPQQRASPSDTTAAARGNPILQRADFDLGNYEGDVVLLNFWATWCAPCRAEMPDLVKLQRDLDADGLQIVGVATDRQGRKVVARYLKRQPVNYPTILDPEQKISARYGGVAALPTSLVIGPGGQVRRRIVGRVRPAPLRQRLKEVLAGGSRNGNGSQTDAAEKGAAEKGAP